MALPVEEESVAILTLPVLPLPLVVPPKLVPAEPPKSMVAPDMAELPLSLSVSVEDAVNSLPHLTEPVERVGVLSEVECFVTSIDAELDVTELYSVFPAKLAVTVIPVPVVPTAVIVTAPVLPLPSVVPDGEPETAEPPNETDAPDIAALLLSLSVSIADALNVLLHLIEPTERDGVLRAAVRFVTSIEAELEEDEVYAVSPAKFAITVALVVGVLTAVTETEADNAPPVVVVPVPALDIAVPVKVTLLPLMPALDESVSLRVNAMTENVLPHLTELTERVGAAAKFVACLFTS